MKRSPRVIWLEEKVRGDDILDIGFVGEYEESLAHRLIAENNSGSRVVGLDVKKSIRSSVSDHGVQGDMFRLPFSDASFDAVVFAEVLEHVATPADALEEISRVLIPEGRLYLTTPNPFGLYRYLRNYLLTSSFDVDAYLGADDHCQFVDPLSLSKLLENYQLEVEEITFRNVSLPKAPTLPDWKILRHFPFDRGGSYTCIIATKSAGPF